MRVLHLDSGREMRGGQWQALRLMEGLERENVQCTLLAPAGSPLAARAAGAGIATEPLGIAAAARLARKSELVHAHDARSHTIGAALASARLIVSRRVAFPVRSRCKYRRALRYIAVSDHVARVLMDGGVPGHMITVVHDGVPLTPSRPRGERIIAPLTDDPQKGADLVRAAGGLARVSIDFTRDLDAGLHTASLLVYITRSEGLGSGILLAMAAGVPVIASDTGGIPEIICNGVNGLLTENEPHAIAACIRRIVEEPVLAAHLAQEGRRTVETRFFVERMVGETLAVYRQVLA